MKKIFSAFLLMTMMVFSVGSFVSCSDLENELAQVEGTANDNAAAIADLNSKLAALQTALTAAQADADAAMQAADAAKAAAATAKAEAIEAAKAEVEKAIADLQAGHKTDIDAVNAKVASLEAALELKADKATVDLLVATLEEYKKALDAEDTELWTAVSELQEQLVNLQGSLDKVNMDIEDLQMAIDEAVKAMKDINVNLVSIIEVLTNQIQSVVFVPEYDADVIYAQRYTAGKVNTNYLATATYEVRPAELVKNLTSQNVGFVSVDVKTKAAAAPETFAAEVISTDPNTGRIVVAAVINDKDSKKDDNDYDKLANGKLALSLNIASAELISILLDEDTPSTLDLGTYVSSEYVTVEAKADAPIAIGFPNKKDKVVEATYTNDIDMPWNTAVAESVKPLFTAPVNVLVEGRFLTVDEANALLGTTLAVTSKVETTYKDAEEKKTYPVAVTGKDINATASLVASADYPGDKAVGKMSTSTLTVTVADASKTTVATLTGTATYEVTNKKSDIAFAAVNEPWKYTYGDKMTVKGREIAVSNYDKFTKDETLGTFTATWKEGESTKTATTTVTALSSKAVTFTDVELPFTPGKATTYTFKGTYTPEDATTTYSVAFDVVLGAMPEDTKIDLGTFTVTGDVANSQNVAVSPVAKAIEYIKAYDSSIVIEKAYAEFEETDAVAGVKGDGVTLNGKENANAASLTVLTDWNEKDSKVRDEKSYVTVAPVVDYVNTVVVVKTYEFCGVQFTYTATVKTEKPAIKFVANDVFVKDGVATVDGTVKLPITKSKTAEVTGTSVEYALAAIDLRNYVHVEMPADVKENGYELRYTLKTPLVNDKNEPLYDKNQVAPRFAQYTAVDVKRTVVGLNTLTWNMDLNALDFEIALVSSSRSTDRNEDGKVNAADDVVFGTVDVKLQIPTLVTFAAEETVSAKYVNGVATTANIVNALTIVDKFGNNVYNPYATTLNEIFKGYNATLYNGKVQNPVTLTTDNFFNVYDMAVAADELKNVKVYLNNTEIAQSQVKFTYVQSTGEITLSEENANLQGDVKFEVPVTLTYMYDNYGKLAQKATAVVVFSQNAQAGEGTEVSFPNPSGAQWEFKASFSFMPNLDAEHNVILDENDEPTGEWVYETHILDFGVTTEGGFTWGAPSAYEEGSYMPMMTAPYCDVIPTDSTSGEIVVFDNKYDENTYETLEGKGDEIARFKYTNYNGEKMTVDLGEIYSDPQTKSTIVECTVLTTPVEISGGGLMPWNN